MEYQKLQQKPDGYLNSCLMNQKIEIVRPDEGRVV